jgi:hypothetical protein
LKRTVYLSIEIENDDQLEPGITVRMHTEGPEAAGAHSWAELLAVELPTRIDDCMVAVAKKVGNYMITSQEAPARVATADAPALVEAVH